MAIPLAPKKILVVKWSALGDVVIASAVIEDIARAYPGATLHLNTQANCAGLFEDDPRFAEVWAIDVRSKTRRWANTRAWLKKVRNEKYDLLIDLQASDHSRFLLALLLLSGGAPRVRVGNLGGFPYTHRPAIAQAGGHALPMMQSVLHAIGIATTTQAPVLHAPPGRAATIADLRRVHGLATDAYIVLLPGSHARVQLKRWGTQRYIELAQRLHAQGVARIVLVGGADEVDVCAEIAASGDWIVNLNGQLQLLDIAPLCAGAAAIVGNDTGTAHFASIAGKPLLVVCGPTDPRRVKPIGPQVVAIQASLPCINCYGKTCTNPEPLACMTAITPTAVAAMIPRLRGGELVPGQTLAGDIRSF